MPDLIPLDKLISRLRTDLKLTKTSWIVKTDGPANVTLYTEQEQA